MMINESVKYSTHSTSRWAAKLMWVTAAAVEALQSPSASTGIALARSETGVKGLVSKFGPFFFFFFYVVFFFFFFHSCLFDPLWKASCRRGGSDFWESTRIKIQVQGREDERWGGVWDSWVSAIVESIHYWTWQEINGSSEVSPFPTCSILRQ